MIDKIINQAYNKDMLRFAQRLPMYCGMVSSPFVLGWKHPSLFYSLKIT